MDDLYSSAVDTRTKNFIIVTLGAIKSPLGLKTVELGLEENDPQTKFHAIVALSQMNVGVNYDWSKLISLLESQDEGLRQASILTLSTHKVLESKSKILEQLGSDSRNIRFASATGLIYFLEDKALPTLREILKLEVKEGFNLRGWMKTKYTA